MENRPKGFLWNLLGMKYLWSLTSVVMFRLDPRRGWSREGQKMARWVPFFKELLKVLRLHEQTKCIAMLEASRKKCCYLFYFLLRSKFLTRCLKHVVFGLCHFDAFSCNSFEFLCFRVSNIHLDLCNFTTKSRSILTIFLHENILCKTWAYK